MRVSTAVAGVSTSALALMLVAGWLAPWREFVESSAKQDCAICDDPDLKVSCPPDWTLGPGELTSFVSDSVARSNGAAQRYLLLSGGG
jgi:hypothetical protein